MATETLMLMLRQTKWLVFSAAIAACTSGCIGGSNDSPASTGTGGSMSRFAIVDDHLYALTDKSLHLFDITDAANPQATRKIDMGIPVETLFAYRNFLFVGGPEGMYIYDNTDPAAPDFYAGFSHARAKDPVVVQGNYAYITLNSGRRRWAPDILEIVDLTDLRQPVLVTSVLMESPRGLAIAGDTLFVCDGPAGLKAFSVTDPAAPVNFYVADDVDCYDLIPLEDRLVVSAKKGLLQYSYATLPPTLLSTIAVTQPQ